MRSDLDYILVRSYVTPLENPIYQCNISCDTTYGEYSCGQNPTVNAFEQKEKIEDSQQLAIDLKLKKRLQTDFVIKSDKPSPSFYAGVNNDSQRMQMISGCLSFCTCT